MLDADRRGLKYFEDALAKIDLVAVLVRIDLIDRLIGARDRYLATVNLLALKRTRRHDPGQNGKYGHQDENDGVHVRDSKSALLFCLCHLSSLIQGFFVAGKAIVSSRKTPFRLFARQRSASTRKRIPD